MPGNFNLAKDRNTMLPTEIENRDIKWHTGACYNQVSRCKMLLSMATEIHPHTSLLQLIKIIQKFGATIIGQDDSGPLSQEKLRQAAPG